MPFLSIITPLHNKGAYITETIEPTIGQLFVDYEMIIVENHSSDGGLEIVLKEPLQISKYSVKLRLKFIEVPRFLKKTREPFFPFRAKRD